MSRRRGSRETPLSTRESCGDAPEMQMVRLVNYNTCIYGILYVRGGRSHRAYVGTTLAPWEAAIRKVRLLHTPHHGARSCTAPHPHAKLLSMRLLSHVKRIGRRAAARAKVLARSRAGRSKRVSGGGGAPTEGVARRALRRRVRAAPQAGHQLVHWAVGRAVPRRHCCLGDGASSLLPSSSLRFLV